MRDLKFRFLRTDINGDKFWEYRIFPDDLYNNDCSDLGANFSTLSQFTGLKDKNGKEIYEGDIIQEDIDNTKTEIKNYTVKFIDGGFRPLCNNNDEFEDIIYDLNNTEIIGNIFENPELISIDK